MRIGIAGLGIMGAALATRLLDQGADLTVTNRTAAKAAPFLERGAKWALTPGALAAESDLVISFVTNANSVSEIVHGEDGILKSLPQGSVHCEMSTVAPAQARHFADAYRQAGKQFVYAPVLGSKNQILQGVLLVFGGGEQAAVEICRPVWHLFAGRIWTLPSADKSATVKLACNMMIAHMILGLGQSMLFVKKGGVDPALILDVILASNLASPMYASKGKTILEQNFAANFVVDNMLKDLNLAVGAGLENGLSLPFVSLAREMFVAASANGHGNEDYSAVLKVLEDLAAAKIVE